jgi:tRNA(Leu) C34 or U34 (ribose-2'-O)-methylase TrmL
MFHLKVFNNASWDDVKDECSGRVILADHKTPEESINAIDDEVVEAENYDEDPEAVFNDDKDEHDEHDRSEDLRKIYNVPAKSYSDLVFDKDSSYVVVVGGETEGLSESSFQFASEREGIRVNIPLAATVSSLNASTAFGIISFEIKRQLYRSSS